MCGAGFALLIGALPVQAARSSLWELCAAFCRISARIRGQILRYSSTVLTHTHREPRSPGEVCCDISSQEVNLGPKQAISQHTGRGFCGFLRLVWLLVLVWLPVREGAECAGATMRQCDNAVNPARQGSGAGPGAAWRCGSRRRRAGCGCGYAVGRPAAIQASVPPEMLWIVKLWGFRWDSKALAALALRPPSWQIT